VNTPNKLTMFRIALIPVFLIILYLGFKYSNIAAMAVFIIASLTDLADGYIARKNGQVTDFGKFMDPIADKILVVAAMLWFVDQSLLPAWVVLIVIIREFMVTALRLVAVEKGRVIAAGLSGKVKTAVTMFCLIVMFLPLRQWMVYVCIAAITLTTVVSGIEYFIRNKDCLSWET
jgi:CDP-diacylglycerol--glycerol-3-phosphate 3-phosphatidyltransferase